MSRNAGIVLSVFLLCLSSEVQDAPGNVDVCAAAEEACVWRGKSMMQVSSSYAAVLSQNKDIPETNVDSLPQSVNELKGIVKSHCHSNINASAVPLTMPGFNTVQQACCAPEMADFIKRFIEKDNNEVCNMGALNGFSSQYDCPGDNGFSQLTTDLTQAQSGQCAWIRNSQAPTCPVMQSSCLHYPSPSTPSGPGPFTPSMPSTPSSGSSPVGPPAPAPSSSAPCNVASSTTTTTTMPFGGHYLVTDHGNHRILKCPPNSLGADCIVAVGTGVQGSSASQLSLPYDAVLDADSNYIIADTSNNRIQKCPPTSSAGTDCITLVQGPGPGATQVRNPHGISIDLSGNYLVIDSGNNRVQKCTTTTPVSCSTVVRTDNDPYMAVEVTSGEYIVAVYPGYLLKCPTGAASNAACVTLVDRTVLGANPGDFAIDSSGNYIITNGGHGYVVKCSASPPHTVAGNGGPCTTVAGNGGPGSGPTQLGSAWGVAIDGNGDYLICDSVNNRIQKCPAATPGGDCTTVAGIGGKGSGLNQLNFPLGVAVI